MLQSCQMTVDFLSNRLGTISSFVQSSGDYYEAKHIFDTLINSSTSIDCTLYPTSYVPVISLNGDVSFNSVSNCFVFECGMLEKTKLLTGHSDFGCMVDVSGLTDKAYRWLWASAHFNIIPLEKCVALLDKMATQISSTLGPDIWLLSRSVVQYVSTNRDAVNRILQVGVDIVISFSDAKLEIIEIHSRFKRTKSQGTCHVLKNTKRV